MKMSADYTDADYGRDTRKTKKNLDRDLWKWFCTNRTTNGSKMSKPMLQTKAKWAFHQAGMLDFKASDGWYRRFINRWRNSNLLIENTSIEPTLLPVTLVTNNSETNQTAIIETPIPVTHETSETELHSTHTISTVPIRKVPSSCVDTLDPNNHSANNFTVLTSRPYDPIVNIIPISSISTSSLAIINSTSISASSIIDNTTDFFSPPLPIKQLADYASTSNTFKVNISNVNPSVTKDCLANNWHSNEEVASGSTINMSDINDDYEGEIIDCLSKFIDTSELSQTSMDFFYDSDDSTFSTAQNALILAETENQSKYDNMIKSKELKNKLVLNTLRKRRKRGERYLPRFKEKVLAYVANQHTIKSTGKKFKIDQMTISMWKKEMMTKKLIGRLNNTSTSAAFDVRMSLEEKFLTWLRRCRERKVDITVEELKKTAEQLIEEGSVDTNPKWFVMWTNRFNEIKTYEEGIEILPQKKERNIKYPDEFKHEVAAFAELKSQISVAKLFNVSRKRVFDWLKIYRENNRKADAPRPTETPDDNKINKRSQSHLPDANIDEQVWSWYQAQQLKPNNKQVRAKGIELYRSKGNTDVQCSYGWYRRWCSRYNVTLRHDADKQLLQWTLTQLEANNRISHHSLQVQALRLLAIKRPGFKASASWALRFCRRHPHLLQVLPSLTTPLPSNLTPKITRYRYRIRSTVTDKNLSSGSVGNVDELHLSFASATSDPHAKKLLLLRKSAMDNCHATIVLACLADGNMLPPAVILKGNPDEPPPEVLNSNLLVLYQAKAQLDETCMLKWLEHVWFRDVEMPNLLIADCFPPHSTTAVKQVFAERGSVVRIIPGGCTSKLQPLDVAIKMNFQSHIEKYWSKYNTQRVPVTPLPWETANKFKMPDIAEITSWVQSAYENIQTTQQETIRRSFLVTGLTVAANHSEDHFIENLSMIPNDLNNK